MQALRDRGAGRSAFAAKDGTILGGNQVYKAAQELGIPVREVQTKGDELVVVVREDLDPDSPEARMMAVEDNAIAEQSLTWDVEMLKRYQEEWGVDLGAIWEEEEFPALFPEAEEAAREPETPTEEVPEQNRVERGQIWELGAHRLLCGDCRDESEIARLLGEAVPTFVWADPPYGMDFVKRGRVTGTPVGDRPPVEAYNRKLDPNERKRRRRSRSNLLKKNGERYDEICGDENADLARQMSQTLLARYPDAVQVWWGGNFYADALPPSPGWLFWDKEQSMPSFGDGELAWTSSTTPPKLFRHLWNGMIKASENGERRSHPTQKPIALARFVFEKYGEAGDIIFDPFAGVGCSLLAAEELGDRACYAVEVDPDYCAVILQRWEKQSGEKARLLAGDE